MHRRKPMMDSPPPAELLRFRPDNWTGPAHETSWHSAYERWCAARQEWRPKARLAG